MHIFLLRKYFNTTASDLEWARASRNETIIALQACVADYDALKTAEDGK